MKFIKLENITISYNEAGLSDQPNLIFLHGNSEDKKLFTHYQKEYFKDYHTFALDSRGHGETISNDESLSIDQMSDDVIEFCQTVGICKTYLVGYSDGGNIALFLAKKRPDIFEKIVAISPNFLACGMVDKELKIMKQIYKWLQFLQKLGCPTKRKIMQLELMLTDIGLTEHDLQSVHAHLCILYAQNDMIKEEHVQQIAQLVRGTHLVKVSHCDHFSIVENENAINEIKKFFLTGIRG